MARRKQDLPEKVCESCGRPFAWRKKWERVWDQVRYCSDACRKMKGGSPTADTARRRAPAAVGPSPPPGRSSPDQQVGRVAFGNKVHVTSRFEVVAPIANRPGHHPPLNKTRTTCSGEMCLWISSSIKSLARSRSNPPDPAPSRGKARA